jgi:DNA-binding MarR family transcriptional regulator
LSAEESRELRFVRAETREDILAEVAEELRLSGVTNDIADQVTADYLGLNRTDTRCLDIIERLDGVSAGRLATEAGLSTGAVTTVLDRLERAGYARRVPDPGDRRRVLVELTPGARQLLRELLAPLVEGTVRQLEGYTTEEVSLVRDFMRDHRRLNEAHTERVRARRRFDQEGEAAS